MTMIVFYESKEPVWFKQHCYAELTTDKTFFSNYNECVEDFNNKDIEEFKSLVKSWLPIGKFSGNEDNTILYMPFGMKEMLSSILEKFGFKTKQREVSSVPTSRELGLGQGERRTVFYDNMEITEVMIMMSKQEELVKLLDDIVAEDNEIDAVFIFNDKDGMVNERSHPSPNANRQVDIDSFEDVLSGIAGHAISGKRRTSMGALEYRTYHFSNGILNVTVLDEGFSEKSLLCFASATPDGLGMMLRYRRRNMPTILEKFHEIGI
ncbi:MAG TPA: hypothetical protein EYP59_11565 [Thiotrichaceae bacterium]|nr:hypothetical protein [Thiotrichaceae bacterium]